MNRRTLHPALVRVGWGLLWAGTLTLLVVSLSAAYVVFQGRCTSHLQYTFAPLLISCGPRSAGDVLLGALGTLLVCGGPAAAMVLAVVSWFTVVEPRPRVRRTRSVWLGVTALLVSTVMLLVFASTNSPDPWGTNAWMFFTGMSGFATLTGCSIVNVVIVRVARSQNATVSGNSS